MVLHVEKTLKTNIPKNLSKSQKFCKEYKSGGVLLQSNHFFAVLSNFTYDSEAYDLMKLYLETLLEILVSSLLFLDSLSLTLKCHLGRTLKPLLHVQCGYRKQFIPNINFLECNSADISLA